MTREEAIKNLQTWLSKGIYGMTNERLGYLEGWFHKKDKEAFNMAIEALEQNESAEEWYKLFVKKLEQEPILDKIRAEIIELRSKQNVGVLECLDIIDKYIGGEKYDMDEYKKHVIDYVKKNMECMAYRDYIVEHLENENLYDAIENYKHEVTKEIEDGFIDEVEARTMMWCLDTLDKHISGKAESEE